MSTFHKEKLNEFLLHPVVLLLLISFFTICFLTGRLLRKNSSNKRLPPSPPKLPILGNLHQMSALTHRSFQSLGKTYGPIMLLHFGNRPLIIVQSADAASEIVKKHDLIFADKPDTTTVRRLFYDLKDVIMAPYGEYWRKSKSICILQLLSGSRVQSFSFIREEETALLMKKIGSSRSSVNLTELFDSLTNDVICRAAFGRKYSEGEAGMRFLMLLREVLQLMGKVCIGDFIPWLSWINAVDGFKKRVDKAAKDVDEFLEGVINEHLREGPESSDTVKDESTGNFVDILLDIYKENTAGVSIDRTSIKAIILDMLVGGTETTSAALGWAMTELLRSPRVMKNLQKEIRGIMKDRRDITDKDLGELHYLKAVLKETLRLHPPVPFLGRKPREDVRIMGYDIAAGTIIVTNAWAIARDPESWPEPDKFLPERFLNCSIGFKGVDLEFMPFGAGRRGCPGIAFAVASVELVLANLVHKFEWGLPNGMKLEDLDIEEQPGVTIHRKHPLVTVATPRT